MRERLRVGEVAKLLTVTPKTLRHYEKLGLLQKPERSEAGYRLYSADDLLRLRRIKRLRSLGLSPTQVKGVQDRAQDPESPQTWRRAERQTSRRGSALPRS